MIQYKSIIEMSQIFTQEQNKSSFLHFFQFSCPFTPVLRSLGTGRQRTRLLRFSTIFQPLHPGRHPTSLETVTVFPDSFGYLSGNQLALLHPLKLPHNQPLRYCIFSYPYCRYLPSYQTYTNQPK